MPRGLLVLLLALLCSAFPAGAADGEGATPLVVGGRTVHVFRARLGAFSPAERADGARVRILRAFERPGEGWTSVKSTPQGVEVRLDDAMLFVVLAGDAREAAGETPEDLANQASRALQTAWREARERRDPRAGVQGAVKVALATVLLAAALVVVAKLSTRLRRSVATGLHGGLAHLPALQWVRRVTDSLPAIASRLVLLLAWLLGMALAYLYLSYALAQFALTRPAGEAMSNSIVGLLAQALDAVVGSLPGLFVAVVIFLLVWIATRVSSEFFAAVEAGPADGGVLNAHTAPTTRRLVNTARCGCSRSRWPIPICRDRTPKPSRGSR